MTPKLHALIFLFVLLSCARCTCSKGYFTKDNPCDTQAALLHCRTYISSSIWSYSSNSFYIPLDGIEGNIELDIQTDTPLLVGYIRFEPEDQYELPNIYNAVYTFDVEDDINKIPSETLTRGMKPGGRMLLTIDNNEASEPRLKIRYYTTKGNCKRPIPIWLLAVVIGGAVTVLVGILIGIYLYRKAKRNQRHARAGQRIHPDVLQQQGQNNLDLLTPQDLQRYFPKKSFGKLENPFHQTGCSVCLEDFSAATVCHQLYCNHIFHEACIQQWSAKHNSCPECRVSIEKKAIEEFLKAKKKKNQTAGVKSRVPITPGKGKNPSRNEEEMQTLTLH